MIQRNKSHMLFFAFERRNNVLKIFFKVANPCANENTRRFRVPRPFLPRAVSFGAGAGAGCASNLIYLHSVWNLTEVTMVGCALTSKSITQAKEYISWGMPMLIKRKSIIDIYAL